MPEFLKKNPMIVAGIALPLIVALFFVAASKIPRALVDPPAYDFLLITYEFKPGAPGVEVRFDVQEERVRARAYEADNNYRNVPRLFRYEHASQSIREITVDPPEDFEDGSEFTIDELEGLRVSSLSKAPDGYEFTGAEYRSDGIMQLFFGGRRYRGLTLSKNGAIYEVPNPDTSRYYYGNASFLAWVTDD